MGTKEWTYKTTHPWITFELDPASFTPELWVLLGECQSKCEHVAGVPLRPSIADELSLIYLTKGVNATTAIEGNTLSEAEVRNRIQQSDSQSYSNDSRIQEIDNIVSALRETTDEMRKGGRKELSIERIKSYNLRVLKKLPVANNVRPGEIRNHGIAVGMYRGIPHDECEHCLKELCRWLNTITVIPNQPMINSIVRAIMAHLYIAWIHPFGDGNGRTARLVEVELLLRAGVPEPSAHLLSNFFNATRKEYYEQLEQSSISGGNIVPFLQYAMKGFVDTLKGQLMKIRWEQWESLWTNHVHEQFRNSDSESEKRKRELVLEISNAGIGVPKELIVELLPRSARAYGNLSDKTLARDISVLIERGMLRVDETTGTIRPNREAILAFLPHSFLD